MGSDNLQMSQSLAVVTQSLKAHYSARFAEFGALPQGVDWGRDEDVRLRYDKMLAVINRETPRSECPPTLLDAGCGFGGLFRHARDKGIPLDYTGADVAENMIRHAQQTLPQASFVVADVFELPDHPGFDYVVCNGILTQKLSTSTLVMNRFADRLIRKLFGLCRRGAVFNVMSSQVNFTAEHLYYRSPVEMLAFCLDQVTRHVRLDHAYPLYEYTVYLYREGV